MRTDKLKAFLWILPFFLLGFLPVGASSPEGGTAVSLPASGGEAGLSAASGPEGLRPGGRSGLSLEEKEIVSRMELLENLELLENMELYEDFFLLVKEDEE